MALHAAQIHHTSVAALALLVNVVSSFWRSAQGPELSPIGPEKVDYIHESVAVVTMDAILHLAPCAWPNSRAIPKEIISDMAEVNTFKSQPLTLPEISFLAIRVCFEIGQKYQ